MVGPDKETTKSGIVDWIPDSPTSPSRYGRALRPAAVAGVGILGLVLLAGRNRRFEAPRKSRASPTGHAAKLKWWQTTGCQHLENLHKQGFSIKDAAADMRTVVPIIDGKPLFSWKTDQAMTMGYSRSCKGDRTGMTHPWPANVNQSLYPQTMKDFLIEVRQRPHLLTKSGRYTQFDYSDAELIRKPEGDSGKMRWFIDGFTPSKQTRASRAITGIPILSQRVSNHLKGHTDTKNKLAFGKTRRGGGQQWTTSEFKRLAHRTHPTTDFDYSLLPPGKIISGQDYVKGIFCEETYPDGTPHGQWNPDGVMARRFLGIGRERGTGCSICKGVWNSNLPANLYFLAIYDPNIPESARTLHNAAFFKVGVTQSDFPDVRRRFIQADLNSGGSAGWKGKTRIKNTAGPYTGYQTVMLGNIWYKTGYEALKAEQTFVGKSTHLNNPPTRITLDTNPATGAPYKFRGSQELVNKNELPNIELALANADKQYNGGKVIPDWLSQYRPKAPSSMYVNVPLWRTY